MPTHLLTDQQTSLPIFLIGMPGVGKSYWARIWGARHDVPALDLDAEIEWRVGESIAALIAESESHFRMVEEEVLGIINTDDARTFILATGGGTPCYSNNMQQMKEAGFVVYLKAGIPTLLRNLANDDQGKRPLLQGRDLDTKLEALLEQRAPFYEQAHYTIIAEKASEASLDFIIAADAGGR